MSKKKEKTALVLAGGGARGAYEAGAWQALTELGIDIDIVTGASVGSINGAMVSQGELELAVDMWKAIETHMVFDLPEGSQTIDYAKEMVKNKGAGASGLKELLTQYVDEEKIRKSPIDYGLVVVELANMKPHYLFIDQIDEGKLVDYIMASSTVFPAIKAYEIDGKEYIDGGFADVLPINMAVERGATRIIAVHLNALGIVNRDSIKNAPNLTLIESKWDLGTAMIFDTANARRIMRLGYLETMKAFGVFEGEYYTFARNTFSKTDLKMADACAHIMDMDPLYIYTLESFLKKLEDVLSNCGEGYEEALAKFKKPKFSALEVTEIIKDIKNIANDNIVCMAIAAHIKEKGKDSFFLTKPIAKLFPEIIMAAKFLVKYGLI
ncbi:MAG: patatin-like phospholipase family protein [Firmicutes bacterium]|nr:patatin-like phospholipase family protein [Bacillota bacterium]